MSVVPLHRSARPACSRIGLFPTLALVLLTLPFGCAKESSSTGMAGANSPRTYDVRGVVKSVQPDELRAVIQHEAIPGYMRAMTMPFRVKDAAELKGVAAGSAVRFQFHVTPDESWMDH